MLRAPSAPKVYATCSLLHEENDAVAQAFERGPSGDCFRPWPFQSGRQELLTKGLAGGHLK